MTIAAGGTGSLSVTNGAVADVAAPVYVGGSAGSQGTVMVDGAGSQLASTSLNVGLGGSGDLSVTNGGVASVTAPVIVGLNLGSTGHVTIDGKNSQLVNNTSSGSPNFTIGQGGMGRLEIAHGGSLSGPYATLTIVQMPGRTEPFL